MLLRKWILFPKWFLLLPLKLLKKAKTFQVCIGSKILQIQLREYGVYFNDTFNYLPMSLRKLAAAFSLEMEKSFFPMTLLTPENYNTCIPWPELSFWEPEKLEEQDRLQLIQWHKTCCEQYGGYFDFNHHLELYCQVLSFLISIKYKL